MQGVESKPVDELRRSLDAPNREVAGLACLKPSDLSAQAERARRLARHPSQALLDREAKQRRRHVPRQQKRCQRRGARVAVGRSEEHKSDLQSLMRTSYAVFCLRTKKTHLAL